MSRQKVENKSRAKTQYSRVIQVVLCGALLKDFDAEVIRAKESRSRVGRDLIKECLERKAIQRIQEWERSKQIRKVGANE